MSLVSRKDESVENKTKIQEHQVPGFVSLLDSRMEYLHVTSESNSNGRVDKSVWVRKNFVDGKSIIRSKLISNVLEVGEHPVWEWKYIFNKTPLTEGRNLQRSSLDFLFLNLDAYLKKPLHNIENSAEMSPGK